MASIKPILMALCEAQDVVTHLNEKGPGFKKETQEAVRVRNALIDKISQRFDNLATKINVSTQTVEAGAVFTGVKIDRLG